MNGWLISGALGGVGLVAGFVDAIAGGGGLLTLPALLLAGVPARYSLGTNKGQSIFGTATALRKYWHSPLLDRQRAVQSFVPALAGAALGTMLVLRVPPARLEPLIMALLAVAAVLVIVQRPSSKALMTRHRPGWMAAGVGFALAFYDGFFGPGTGTFLILAYTYIWHDPLDSASANAKVVNFASNLASMVSFAWQKMILWPYALPMVAGQIVGGWLGAHLTIRAGRTLVRYAVVAVCAALIVRLGWKLVMQA